MKKIVFSWVFCVLGLVALAAWLGRSVLPVTSNTVSESALVQGKFSLKSVTGKTVTEQDFRGRYMLVYFGYTRCPDMCPTSLLLIENVLEKQGPLAEKIQPLFITLDPERDTPKVAADYASHFGQRMVGLSGSPAQIKATAEHFKIYYQKSTDKDSALGYTIDHSGFIYLIGPKGEYVSHFPYNVSERELEEGLKRYVH